MTTSSSRTPILRLLGDWATNSSFDDWLQGPAEYQDLRLRKSHVCIGLLGFEAINASLHSFRHFLIDSGKQLRALKTCGTNILERLVVGLKDLIFLKV